MEISQSSECYHNIAEHPRPVTIPLASAISHSKKNVALVPAPVSKVPLPGEVAAIPAPVFASTTVASVPTAQEKAIRDSLSDIINLLVTCKNKVDILEDILREVFAVNDAENSQLLLEKWQRLYARLDDIVHNTSDQGKADNKALQLKTQRRATDGFFYSKANNEALACVTEVFNIIQQISQQAEPHVYCTTTPGE